MKWIIFPCISILIVFTTIVKQKNVMRERERGEREKREKEKERERERKIVYI